MFTEQSYQNKNMLVLNDCSESHLVTTVAHDTPEFRYTIQIWGDA